MKTEKAERGDKAEARLAAEAGRRARRGKEVLIRGIPVAPGIAIGAVFDTSEPPTEAPRRSIEAAHIDEEKQRLATAVATSKKQVSKLSTPTSCSARICSAADS